MQIAFFDSGIGGITVLEKAIRLMPYENYLYYADTKNVPYGEKSREEVRRYIFEAVDFIASKGVKALVVACNTATSIAIDDLRKRHDFLILGMEPAIKPAVQQAKDKRVLVFATNLTLKENKFRDLVQRVEAEDILDIVPLPGLVRFAEHFEFESDDVHAYLLDAIKGLDTSSYGTVVLGCTHFPYFKKAISKAIPNAIIIDGSEGTVNNLYNQIHQRGLIGGGLGKISFYQSGERISGETVEKYKRLFITAKTVE